jgi:hypothetical protein
MIRSASDDPAFPIVRVRHKSWGGAPDVRGPGFFTDLMDWYKRVLFPCGWGKVDPDSMILLADMEPEGEADGPDPIIRALNFPLFEPPINLPRGNLIIF